MCRAGIHFVAVQTGEAPEQLTEIALSACAGQLAKFDFMTLLLTLTSALVFMTVCSPYLHTHHRQPVGGHREYDR